MDLCSVSWRREETFPGAAHCHTAELPRCEAAPLQVMGFGVVAAHPFLAWDFGFLRSPTVPGVHGVKWCQVIRRSNSCSSFGGRRSSWSHLFVLPTLVAGNVPRGIHRAARRNHRNRRF